MPLKDHDAYLAYQRAQYAKNPQKYKDSATKWKKANPEKLLPGMKRRYQRLKPIMQAKARARYWKNPEAHRAYSKQWAKEHPEEFKECQKRSKIKHADTIKIKRAARYAKDPEKSKQATMAWIKAHPDEARAIRQKRRAAKANAPVNDLTVAQWAEIKAAYDNRCVYCGRKMQRLTQDHITPLSHEGSHTVSNIVPACKSCNSKKKDGKVLCPVQPLLLTMTPARKKAS